MFRFVVWLASALPAASAAASEPAVDAAKVAQVISDPRGLAAPGCAAGVFRNGETLFIGAQGAADVADGAPLDGDTLFYAASISKQFTALAAARLATEGRIDLDDDVRRYLPELPAYQQPVTVRMLMQHTAGVRDSLDLIRLAGVRRAADISKAAALGLVLEQKGVNFTPGTDYAYSNGGYLLLAEIVERVSGRPFAEYAKQEILQPLGMERSHFLSDAPPAARNVAHGYVPVGDGFEIRDTYPRFSGSGGLMLSMNDLARYEYDITVGHRVWTPAVAAVMTAPGVLADGSFALDRRNGLAYAGGLLIGRRNGQHFIQHGGSAEAFKNMYARLPERGLAVAVLCNRGDWKAQDKVDAIMNIVEGPILSPKPASEPEPAAEAGAAPAFTSRVVADGRFVSDELQAAYDLVSADDELRVTISSPFAPAGGRRLTFRRDGDGSYRSSGTRLILDQDARGFVLTTSRIRAIRFQRQD